jgi:hypothetical protein
MCRVAEWSECPEILFEFITRTIPEKYIIAKVEIQTNPPIQSEKDSPNTEL